MSRYEWSRLNHLQVGRYAEYFVKMEFTLFGFQVYTSEVDDRGIDFVVRHGFGNFFEIQVKSIRGLNYVFFQKDKFVLRSSLLAAVVILIEGQPPFLSLIPSLTWEQPNLLMVGRDYEGKQSKPEWGLNLSAKNLVLLESFAFEKMVLEICAGSRQAYEKSDPSLEFRDRSCFKTLYPVGFSKNMQQWSMSVLQRFRCCVTWMC